MYVWDDITFSLLQFFVRLNADLSAPVKVNDTACDFIRVIISRNMQSKEQGAESTAILKKLSFCLKLYTKVLLFEITNIEG